MRSILRAGFSVVFKKEFARVGGGRGGGGARDREASLKLRRVSIYCESSHIFWQQSQALRYYKGALHQGDLAREARGEALPGGV